MNAWLTQAPRDSPWTNLHLPFETARAAIRDRHSRLVNALDRMIDSLGADGRQRSPQLSSPRNPKLGTYAAVFPKSKESLQDAFLLASSSEQTQTPPPKQSRSDTPDSVPQDHHPRPPPESHKKDRHPQPVLPEAQGHKFRRDFEYGENASVRFGATQEVSLVWEDRQLPIVPAQSHTYEFHSTNAPARCMDVSTYSINPIHDNERHVSDGTTHGLLRFVASPSKFSTAPMVDDLKGHAVAFFSLLVAYSIARVAHSDNETTVAGNTAEPSDQLTRPSSKRPRALSDKDLSKDDEHEASESEGEKEPPNQKRKGVDFNSDVHGRSLACPLYKLDNFLYAKCEDWSCGMNRIETVKRHVLGKKHLSSPHLNEMKRKEIKGLGVFRTNEDRWKAMYMKVAGINRNDLFTVPNPYHEVTVAQVDGAHLLQPHSISLGPLTFNWEVQLPDGTPQDLSLNPHADEFDMESRRLSDLYMQRQREIRSQTAFWMQAQRRTAMEEEQRRLEILWTDQQTSLRNLCSRYCQGLPLEAVEADLPPMLTGEINTTPANIALALVSPSCGADSIAVDQRQSGDAQGRRSFDAMPASPNALPFLSDDSGYGTMTENNSCTYTIHCECNDCINPRSRSKL